MCDDDDENEHCIGVALQIFLTIQIGTSVFCFYFVVLPTWLGWSVGGILHAVCFGIVVTLMLVNYFKAWRTDAGSVPSDYTPNVESEHVPALNARFCRKCEHHKPPRAHHCRICKKCVLRMDHHCPWVQNCVGARNLKFFVLFLLYACSSCFYYTVTSVAMIFGLFGSEHSSTSRPTGGGFVVVLISVVVAGCLGLMVLGLLTWNMWLIFRNQTTIENFEVETNELRARREGKGEYRHPWDLGTFGNLQCVFGNSPVYWLLPFAPEATGLDYKTYHELDEETIELV